MSNASCCDKRDIRVTDLPFHLPRLYLKSLIAVRAGATAPSHTIAFELETSPDTCCCVAASENGQLVAAAFGKTVRVFLSNPSGFHKMGEVEVGFGGGQQVEGGDVWGPELLMTQESLDKKDCRLFWASRVVRGNTSPYFDGGTRRVGLFSRGDLMIRGPHMSCGGRRGCWKGYTDD